MTYDTDRQWSDQYVPAIRAIVGPLLIQPASLLVDRNEATDLMLLHARDMRIAARVRRPGFADRYPDDFTLRAQRPNDVPTEFFKVLSGFGDWFFYGHAAYGSGRQIKRWLIVDLDVWRVAIRRRGWERYGEVRQAADGVKFIAFDARKFTRDGYDIVVDQSHPPPQIIEASQ